MGEACCNVKRLCVWYVTTTYVGAWRRAGLGETGAVDSRRSLSKRFAARLARGGAVPRPAQPLSGVPYSVSGETSGGAISVRVPSRSAR